MSPRNQEQIEALARAIADVLIDKGIITGAGTSKASRRIDVAVIIEPYLKYDPLSPTEELAAAYDTGYQHGLSAFAWWKDGDQVVGTMPKLLSDAIADRGGSWNYAPPLPTGKAADLKTVEQVNAKRSAEPVSCTTVRMPPWWSKTGIESPFGGEIEEQLTVFANLGLPAHTNKMRCTKSGRTGLIQYDGSVRAIILDVQWDEPEVNP